jgi:hypothetical protein
MIAECPGSRNIHALIDSMMKKSFLIEGRRFSVVTPSLNLKNFCAAPAHAGS